MRNLRITLVLLSMYLSGVQSFARNEDKDQKKPNPPRGAAPTEKTKPKAQTASKAKTAPTKLDTAKRPPDPLEKTAKTRNKDAVKTAMPVDPLEQGMNKK